VISIAALALTISSASALTGCAPEPVARQFATPQTEFSPKASEVEAELEQLQPAAEVKPESLAWSGKIASASYFRVSENLAQLSRIGGLSALGAVSEKMTRAFYQAQKSSKRTSFSSSLYVSAAIGETREDSALRVNNARRMVRSNQIVIARILTELGSQYRWPGAEANVQTLVGAIQNFLRTFMNEINRRPLDTIVRKEIIAQMESRVFPEIRRGQADAEQIFAEGRPTALLAKFQNFLTRYEITIEESTRARIAQAQGLAEKLDQIASPQDALNVIVDLWNMLSPEERQEKFATISQELYDYFSTRSPGQLRCLQKEDCGRFLTRLARDWKILPELRKYGVEKLRDEMSTAVAAGLKKEFLAQTRLLLPGMPSIVAEKIQTEFTVKEDFLTSLINDYEGFVRKMASRFEKQQLGGEPLAGVEAARIAIDVRPGQAVKVAAIEAAESDTTTGAEAIGASLGLAAERWALGLAKQDAKAYARSFLEQSNKMLAIGGFKTENGQPYSSIAVNVEPFSVLKHLNVRTFPSNPLAFAVPDSLRVAQSSSGYQAVIPNNRRVSAAGQAELLRGLSAMIRYLRDWERNEFDETIGGVAIGQLAPELPAEEMTQKFLPKDMLFSLSVGNAAAILQNMTKKLTPVFVVDQSGREVWVDEVDLGSDSTSNSSTSSAPATMAGLVDIENGERVETVRTADVSRFLLAIVDFLEATEGIEATKSSPLLVASADGKRPLDLLTDARQQLRLLSVGMANFLSHEMQSEDGGFRARYLRSTGEAVASEPRQLLDQVLALRALHRVGHYLDVPVYRWAALDGVKFLNQKMWDASAGFYRLEEGSTRSVDLESLTETLLTVELVRGLLSEKASAQWQALVRPWALAVARF
jgi:hypothetical protein